MSTLVELREKQARILSEARQRYDEISKNTDEGRAKELETQHDNAMAEYDKVSEQIQRSERLAAAEGALDRVIEGRRPNSDTRSDAAGQDAQPTYDKVFAKLLRFGFVELEREERQILRAGATPLAEEVRAQGQATGAAGGYVVPVTLATELDVALKLYGPMMDETHIRLIRTTTGEQFNLPTIDDTSKNAVLIAENAAATDTGAGDAVFGQKRLDAYFYGTDVVRIPWSWLTDSAVDGPSLIAELFAERLGRTINTALTTGTGTNQPNGIVTGATLGKTVVGTNAVTSDEMIDLFHSVDPAYRKSPSCAFMFNDNTLKALRKLKDGQGNYLWQMGNIREGTPDLFLNTRYEINQAMADLATGAKFALFGDMKKYFVRQVGGYQTVVLNERYAEFFQTGMIGYTRIDGEIINSAAIKYAQNA